jgi:hypothetical protein
MVRSLAETTDPPLGCGQGRRMELELVRFGDICCCCFNTLDVGSVSELQ